MEKRDLYDRNKKLTGKFIYKGDKVPKDSYYAVVVIFIQNSEDSFLIQKRSAVKGGKWATTGGHPKAGETSITGLYTEVAEELGLDISNESNIELFKTIFDEDCFVDLYYLKKDINIDSLKLQEEEVSDVMWATKDEIETLIINNEFHNSHIKMYRDCLDYLNSK